MLLHLLIAQSSFFLVSAYNLPSNFRLRHVSLRPEVRKVSEREVRLLQDGRVRLLQGQARVSGQSLTRQSKGLTQRLSFTRPDKRSLRNLTRFA